MSKPKQYDNVRIDKLVHGGQGLGALPDGKKVLVWNTLPGEVVSFVSHKSKSSYIEGIATDIIEASTERATPRDDLYLSTSPWQMMTYGAENRYKRDILIETLERGGVQLGGELEFLAPASEWQYRNKMEYSFWGDEDGLHLALYNRGTHRKQIVTGSSIARPEVDAAAQAICQALDQRQVRAGDLKSVIIRCNQAGDSVAALFTRNEKLLDQLGPDFFAAIEPACKGMLVCFSNPKSPASVMTQELARLGDVELEDVLLGVVVRYDVLSFFQVNLDAYDLALQKIKEFVGTHAVIDMYGGVGSIGLAVTSPGAGALTIVEADSFSVAMAQRNVEQAGLQANVVHATSETALDYIAQAANEAVLIVDPPRAGLHGRVTETINESGPDKIAYLSCNPSTLARDLELLQGSYELSAVTGYNFFPRTPHIEALALLERR